MMIRKIAKSIIENFIQIGKALREIRDLGFGPKS